MLLLPVGWLAGRAWLGSEARQPPVEFADRPRIGRLLRGGWVLACISLFVLTAIVVVDGVRWLETSHTSSYLFQRALFRVVTWVDLPLIPLACVGKKKTRPLRSDAAAVAIS